MSNIKSRFTAEASALADEIEREIENISNCSEKISRLLESAKKVEEKVESKRLSEVVSKLELLLNSQAETRPESRNFILFKAGGDEPVAIDANHVFRLEEIDTNFAELIDDLPVLPYRDKKLRMARLNEDYEINITPDETGACRQKAIIIDHNKQSLVLAVQEFMELITAPFTKGESFNAAFIGKIKLDNKEIDVINTDHLLDIVFHNDNSEEDTFEKIEQSVYAELGIEEAHETNEATIEDPEEEPIVLKVKEEAAEEPVPIKPIEQPDPKRILYVAPQKALTEKAIAELKTHHHEVIIAQTAMAAILILREDKDFDLFVIDVETADVNGLELSEACKGDKAIKHIPILAVTTKKSSYAQEQARKFGIKNFCNRASHKKIAELTKKLSLKKQRKTQENTEETA